MAVPSKDKNKRLLPLHDEMRKTLVIAEVIRTERRLQNSQFTWPSGRVQRWIIGMRFIILFSFSFPMHKSHYAHLGWRWLSRSGLVYQRAVPVRLRALEWARIGKYNLYSLGNSSSVYTRSQKYTRRKRQLACIWKRKEVNMKIICVGLNEILSNLSLTPSCGNVNVGSSSTNHNQMLQWSENCPLANWNTLNWLDKFSLGSHMSSDTDQPGWKLMA